MLGLIAAVYLLLALRVQIAVQGAVHGAHGGLALRVHAAGLTVSLHGGIRYEKEGMALYVSPRHGHELRLKRPSGSLRRRLKKSRRYILAALREIRFERIGLQARLGLGDAAATALVVGALRALLSGLFQALRAYSPCSLQITPDYGRACLSARGCCIFSFQAGDIMLAAMKTALKKTGKEGFGWKSIPLKA